MRHAGQGPAYVARIERKRNPGAACTHLAARDTREGPTRISLALNPGYRLLHQIRRAHTKSPQVKAKITAAESASDQWMPITLPIRPTDTPLKARKPRLAML
jgi:hypothetical protein